MMEEVVDFFNSEVAQKLDIYINLFEIDSLLNLLSQSNTFLLSLKDKSIELWNNLNTFADKFNRDICYNEYSKNTAWTRVKGMMSTISCTEVISVSASCSRCYSLTQSSLFPSFFVMFLDSCMPCYFSSYSYIQRSQIPVSVRFTT